MSQTDSSEYTQTQLNDIELFGQLNGKNVSVFTLKNKCNMTVELTNYGARITRFLVPDSNGITANVVLGYDNLQDYLNSDELYYGAIVGRYANRIANGSFPLDKNLIQLEKNNAENHLHGGFNGLHAVVWDVVEFSSTKVVFRHLSENGEGGYPGNLEIVVSYILNDNGELIIDYQANTDELTIINLTNHAYFNLSGAGNGSIGNHLFFINADFYTPINQHLIPTGELRPVYGSPFNFRMEKEIGKDWDDHAQQIKLAGGFDHNFVIYKTKPESLVLAARVKDPKSGRILEVETTEPGIQLYTANALSGKDIGREGIPYNSRTAFCLETQHFPDSPNKPHFPSTILEPGKQFTSKTIYRFLIK